MSLCIRRTVPVLMAAALLLAAAPAGADSWKKHHKHHHKQWKHHWKHHGGHHRHYEGCGHAGWYGPAVVEYHSYGYPVYHYGTPAYLCRPCGHYFDSYDHLSHHVHHHHHVAAFELPSVIFQASIGGGVGWVFGD